MPQMSRSTALQRFCSARVAVLGTTGGNGAPHLVPVTFALLDGYVVFAVDHKPKTATRLRRLTNIDQNSQVSFLVDRYDDDWNELWWVRIDADAEILRAAAGTGLAGSAGTERDRALNVLSAKYHQYREFRPHGDVVSSRIRSVTGWAVREAAAPADRP